MVLSHFDLYGINHIFRFSNNRKFPPCILVVWIMAFGIDGLICDPWGLGPMGICSVSVEFGLLSVDFGRLSVEVLLLSVFVTFLTNFPSSVICPI